MHRKWHALEHGEQGRVAPTHESHKTMASTLLFGDKRWQANGDPCRTQSVALLKVVPLRLVQELAARTHVSNALLQKRRWQTERGPLQT